MAMHAETRNEIEAIQTRLNDLITRDQESDAAMARSFDVVEQKIADARRKIDRAYEIMDELETELSVLRNEVLA